MFSPAKAGVDQQLRDFTDQFASYVLAFDMKPPFRPTQLATHLRTLELRSKFPTALDAARDETFARFLYTTLRSWGIGAQGAELVSQMEFHNQLFRIAPMLTPLENRRIDDPHTEVNATACLLWEIIKQLNVAVARKTKKPVRNRIVGGTKALHHLLPNLVFPIDRAYTQTFFKWGTDFDNHPEECFKFGFEMLSHVALRVSLASHVGPDWRTSLAKILDNGVVGYCQVHGLISQNTKYRKRQQLKYKAMIARAKELGIWDSIEAEAKQQLEDQAASNKAGYSGSHDGV